LQGFARTIGSHAGVEQGFSEGEADVDGVFAETAGVRQQDAGFGFGNGLEVIAQMSMEFAGCMEAAELEVDIS
jgi:hypothetical protein